LETLMSWEYLFTVLLRVWPIFYQLRSEIVQYVVFYFP
jgi:hypothetical protein